jgi:putative transposase
LILAQKLGHVECQHCAHVRPPAKEASTIKQAKCTEEQITYALCQGEAGTPATQACRERGIAEQTCYRRSRKYAGMGVAELRLLRQLEEENRQLKPRVADLTLEKHTLHRSTTRYQSLAQDQAG